jgi:hypothetical protein
LALLIWALRIDPLGTACRTSLFHALYWPRDWTRGRPWRGGLGLAYRHLKLTLAIRRADHLLLRARPLLRRRLR